MRTVKIKCRGFSPILFNPMSQKTLEELRTGVREPIAKDRAPEAVAEEKLRLDPETGRLGIPVEMLFGALVAAGRMVPFKAKKMISTAKTTLMPDFLSILDSFMPFTNIEPGKEKEAWRVDMRQGRLRDGTAVCLIRPRFEKWEFEVTVEYNDGKVTEKTVRDLFENAGSCQGLGAFRPNSRGPFGRFLVVEWMDITEDANPKLATVA